MGQAESNLMNQGPPHAQAHVEHDIGDPDLENWEFETRPTASDTPKGFPDVYVNGEDVTVTIDPMKNQHWIRDGSHRHDVSRMRGAIKDHAGVVRAQKIADKGQYRWFELPQTFVPSSKEIDAMPKLTPRCVANSSRGSVGTSYPRPTHTRDPADRARPTPDTDPQRAFTLARPPTSTAQPVRSLSNTIPLAKRPYTIQAPTFHRRGGPRTLTHSWVSRIVIWAGGPLCLSSVCCSDSDGGAALWLLAARCGAVQGALMPPRSEMRTWCMHLPRSHVAWARLYKGRRELAPSPPSAIAFPGSFCCLPLR